MLTQTWREPADFAVGSHVDNARHSPVPPSSSAASVQLVISLCDAAAVTSPHDVRVTSSSGGGHLPRRRPVASAAELARDLELLEVAPTPLPELADDESASVVQAGDAARRRTAAVRCSKVLCADKARRKASSAVVVPSRLTCISRSKRRSRVHALC